MDSKPESLHTHTTLSDGKNTYREMFEAGEKLGFSVMAFTDHDALPNDEQLAYLESVRNSKMKWVIGVEITTGLPPELGAVRDESFHVVGLFVDPKNPALLLHCEKTQKERVQWVHVITKKLQDLGFEIEAKDCFAEAGAGSVGKPHIVEVLMRNETNKNLLESLRERMGKDAQNDLLLKEKYVTMMHHGPGGYPYHVLLGKSAYMAVYSEYEYLLNLDDVVSLIRNAGGIASLAHYFTIQKKIPFPALENILTAGRLDAVETVYRVKPYQPEELLDIKKEREVVKKIALETNTLTTGGPDAHDVEDIESFLEAEDLANETIGMTEKIIASGKVDTRWSSF